MRLVTTPSVEHAARRSAGRSIPPRTSSANSDRRSMTAISMVLTTPMPPIKSASTAMTSAALEIELAVGAGPGGLFGVGDDRDAREAPA